jgi:hypothetical protein
MNALIRTWIRLGLGLLVASGACSDDNSSTPDSGVVKLPDAKVVPDGPATTIDGPTALPDAVGTGNCFSGTPTTNAEIITACTTAQKIDINPTLPLLNTDGSLPDHQHK